MDASGFGRIGEGVVSLVMGMAIALAIFVPLGLWKFVEIVLCVARHISVSVN